MKNIGLLPLIGPRLCVFFIKNWGVGWNLGVSQETTLDAQKCSPPGPKEKKCQPFTYTLSLSAESQTGRAGLCIRVTSDDYGHQWWAATSHEGKTGRPARMWELYGRMPVRICPSTFQKGAPWLSLHEVTKSSGLCRLPGITLRIDSRNG